MRGCDHLKRHYYKKPIEPDLPPLPFKYDFPIDDGHQYLHIKHVLRIVLDDVSVDNCDVR